MRKAIVILISVLSFCLGSFAQTEKIDAILPLLDSNRVVLDYDCIITADNGVPVSYTGNLTAQKGCYILKGNGVEIYCDGGTRWTIDPKSKEVYIEYAEGLDDILANRKYITKLVIANVRKQALDDAADFTFNTGSLDSSWVVTDLR